MPLNEPHERATSDLDNPTQFFLGLMKERIHEKSRQIDSVVSTYGLHVVVDPTSERVHFSVTQAGRIEVGLNGMTRLMAHVFAYTAAYKASSGEQGEQALLNSPQLQQAGELLTWAVTKDVKVKMADWKQSSITEFVPEDLEHLIENCLDATGQIVASAIFANALVWILFHEFVHVQQGHIPTAGLVSIQQEKEADRMAADWLLDTTGIRDEEICLRQMGIAAALAWLVTPTVYLGAGSSSTHPAAHDRLFQTMEATLDENHVHVWQFVQLVLVLHIRNRNLTINEEKMSNDCKANCNYLIDLIASVPTS